MKNKIAIQMDDIKTIDYTFDSSFMIGLEGQRRNYEIFYYHPNDLFIDSGIVKAKGFYLELYEKDNNYFKYLSEKIEINLAEFKFIFLRQDPPFNMHYITSTYLLDCIPKSTIVINNPKAVRNCAEKILPFKFKEFMPPTLISQKVADITNFLNTHKDIITKPLYGNGGEGIYRSKFNDSNLNGIDESKNFLDEPIMAQRYIPEIIDGDRRIILIDGEYFGSESFENDCFEEYDLDANCTTDIADIIILVNIILNGIYDSEADLNTNGVVDIVDIILLVNYILDYFYPIYLNHYF